MTGAGARVDVEVLAIVTGEGIDEMVRASLVAPGTGVDAARPAFKGRFAEAGLDYRERAV